MNFFEDFGNAALKGLGVDTGANAAKTIGSTLSSLVKPKAPTQGPQAPIPSVASAVSVPVKAGVSMGTLALIGVAALLILRRRR